MIEACLLIKEPVSFKQICVIIPPTVREVVGNYKFAQFKKILTTSEYDIRDEFKNVSTDEFKCPTPLEFLLINSYHNQTFRTLAVEAFQFFTGEQVIFDYEHKWISFPTENPEILRCITEENYFDFQNLVRQACGDAVEKPPEPIDPDEDPRVRRIKEKARERDRIKAKKGVQGKGISLETVLVSICCMGIGITPLNIGEMSYASINMIMTAYQNKEKYDLDIRALLAGADSKKIKPKYWIRNTD